MAYIGNSPENIQRGKRFIYEFKATAGQTAFSGADLNNQTLDLLEENEMGVYLNGVRLADSDDYNVSGDTLTLISAASLNDQLTVETQAEIANISSYTRSETDARYINYDGDIINGTLQIAGSGNNIELGDSNKVIFGAGSDLQIFHDGSNSHIKDTATGNLNISGNDVQILNAASNEAMAYFAQDGDVTLYHNGVAKLATTATGANVTGTVTADAITGGTTNFDIKQSTADGSDNKRTRIGGGGDVINTRGAFIELHGNEHTSTGKAIINAGNVTGGEISLRTGGSENVVIAKNGNVGIGTAAPNTRLTVGDGSGTEVLTILAGTTGESQLRFADGTSGSAAYQGRVEYEHTNNILRLGAGGGTDVAIDASGNMDLANGGANLKLYYNNAGQYSANLGWRHLQLGNNGANYLVAGNTATGGDFYFVVNNTTDLSTNNGSSHNGTVAMHIDSSGRLLVGMEASSNTAAGFRVIPNDFMSFTTTSSDAGDRALMLNRQSSDGILLEFKKANSAVGSIQARGGDLVIGTGDTGIRFNDAENAIMPHHATDVVDNQIDLGFSGSSNYRFKDLYLSGGIQFDARSNKLDDYEEGNWTPSIKVENAAAAGITVNHAAYTKIGRLVSLVFDVTINSVTGTNSSRAIQLEGMPFTINTAYGGGPNIGYTNLTNSMSGNLALQGRLNNRYRIVNLNGATGQNASDHIQATTVLRGQFIYHTDQ